MTAIFHISKSIRIIYPLVLRYGILLIKRAVLEDERNTCSGSLSKTWQSDHNVLIFLKSIEITEGNKTVNKNRENGKTGDDRERPGNHDIRQASKGE